MQFQSTDQNQFYTSQQEASAPFEGKFIPHNPPQFSSLFKQNLYPNIALPEFSETNYRLNRIMQDYKYLDDEIKMRINLKKRYKKLSNAISMTDYLIILSELGMVGSSIALPIITPFSVPVSVGLTVSSTILKSSWGYFNKKIEKHNTIELLAKSKRNSIETKFMKAIKDGKLSDNEFNDIEDEIRNYNEMKEKLLKEYNRNINETVRK